MKITKTGKIQCNTNDEFYNEVVKVWSNKNINPIQNYSKSSHELIWLTCEKHGNYKLSCFEFSRGTRCNKCRSFAQWGIDNISEDFLEKYWSDKNTLNPWEIGKASMNKVWMKCQEKDYHEDYEISPNNFIKGKRCSYCKHNIVHKDDSFGQWGIDTVDEDFINKYWSNANELNPFELSVHSGKKIWINCVNKKNHKEYKTTPDKFSIGNRCPICKNKTIIFENSLANIYPKSISIWSELNDLKPSDYAPYSYKETIWKCENNKHDDYIRKISKSVRFDFRCPECSLERTESLLQEKVRLYLESTKFNILHEEKCTIVPKNPKTNHILPFDNEVKELKLVCEVMGNQHYDLLNKSNPWLNGKSPEEYLHYQQLKDRYKRIIAIQQGYYYLEIPYWTDDANETWKQLINNELNKTKL